jgi:hypothetical protein
MIVEKRKRMRNPKPADLDYLVEFDFYSFDDGAEEPITEITPWSIVLAFALLTGLSAYAVGSYFIAG